MNSPKPVINDPLDVAQFMSFIHDNPGVVVFKFGATWCGPCRKVEPYLKEYYKMMPPNVQCVVIDIDESMEVYSYMKTRKMVNGVPALLAYVGGNATYIPDFSCVGADLTQVKLFFTRVYSTAQNIMV
jgi:thiol-disulfide isomerase/thioredoxin